MKFTETMLDNYAAPLSSSEEEKCKNSIRMIRDALKPLGFTDDGKEISKLYDDTLSFSLEMKNQSGDRKIKLFVQGSYANNTNVRTQSDVDIAVIQEEIFRTKYRDSALYPQSDSDYNFSSAPHRSIRFKDEVQQCLEIKFSQDVERKNKSIKIHGNSYRKDADAVPCMRHRDYTNDYDKKSENFIGGIVIIPDDGGSIINYPEQHIKNGREKNIVTKYHYKKMVRIIKKMRYLMQDNNFSSADKVSSFALESLLWNIPKETYIKYGEYRKVFLFNNIINYLSTHKNDISSFKEANGIKDLCPSYSEILRIQEFINDLKSFYEYE